MQAGYHKAFVLVFSLFAIGPSSSAFAKPAVRSAVQMDSKTASFGVTTINDTYQKSIETMTHGLSNPAGVTIVGAGSVAETLNENDCVRWAIRRFNRSLGV